MSNLFYVNCVGECCNDSSYIDAEIGGIKAFKAKWCVNCSRLISVATGLCGWFLNNIYVHFWDGSVKIKLYYDNNLPKKLELKNHANGI